MRSFTKTPFWLLAVAPLAGSMAQSVPSDWKKGAVCYEVFVRSFFDSDGDGIGDLKGLTAKLDYINNGNPSSRRSLGARCIWLMPVVASPSYHGYDATNYYRVSPQYGTNDDFKRMVAAAHQRGIHVLVDMVLNHVSNEHPMFKDALLNLNSPYRSWFRWAPADPKTKGPWGQVVWHRSPVRDEYYYGVFWEGMPDLNYDTPAVREEAKRIARFWLTEMGVDGFRLDAVPYLVEEGDQLAGTRGTHSVLREYASYVRQIAPRSFTVGEVWDSVGAMLPYYPDQLDSYFAFELSDALIDAVRTGSAKKVLNGYLRLQAALPAERWSPFLRNHDQQRTATALGGDIEREKLAATLLLTLPGLPFVYYGEEIGMTGDKPDPRLRTPMQWRRGPAAGFTTGLPWEPLQPDSLTANVEAQERDEKSLLNLYRRLIHLRASSPALAVGALVPLTTTNDATVAFLRRDGTRVVLVVTNLAKELAQSVAISSAKGVLAPGEYRLTSLLGDAVTETIAVGSDARINGCVLVASIAPMTSSVLSVALTEAPGRRSARDTMATPVKSAKVSQFGSCQRK
jgi:glycosidase